MHNVIPVARLQTMMDRIHLHCLVACSQWMKYGLEHDPDLRSVKATRVPANIDCPSLSRHDVQFNWSKERTETPHHRGPGKAAVRDRDDDLADDEEDVVHPQFGSRPRLKKGHRKNRFSSQPPAAGKQRASTTVSESSVKWVASTVQPGPPRHSFNYAASGSQPTHAPAPTYQASPPPMISSPPPMVLEHPLSTAMTQAPASFAIPVRSGSVVNSVPVEVGLAQQPPKPMTAPKSRRGRRPTATASAESFVCPLHMCGARYRGASGLYYHLRTRHPEYNIRELGVRKHREKNTR